MSNHLVWEDTTKHDPPKNCGSLSKLRSLILLRVPQRANIFDNLLCHVSRVKGPCSGLGPGLGICRRDIFNGGAIEALDKGYIRCGSYLYMYIYISIYIYLYIYIFVYCVFPQVALARSYVLLYTHVVIQ